MTLHRFAAEGDLAGLEREFAQGVNVDDLDEGWTPLMLAAKSECAGTDVLDWLVQHGADVNATRTQNEVRPLHLAIKNGDLSKVKCLVSAGANLTYKSSSGYDAMLDAAHSTPESSIELFRYLLDHGAPVNGASKYGETALNVASRNVRMDVVRLLLERGADVEPLRWSDLAKAVALGSVEDVERALHGGVDLLQRDRWGRTPWMLSLELGDFDKAKCVYRAGVDRDLRGHANRSAVAIAAHVGHMGLLNWLIDEGFGLEDRDDFDNTPLMLATAAGNAEAVELLIRRGANVHARTDGAMLGSAMSCASDRATFDILRNAGADLSEVTQQMRQVLRGNATNTNKRVTADEFLIGRSRRFGHLNPEVMTIPFWDYMVVAAERAYSARLRLGAGKDFKPPYHRDGGAEHRAALRQKSDPVWCFERYGQSITVLPDGAIVEIGGEHEDSYDPDFCIYNDVVVHQAGGNFCIYGYPEDVFAPTDFHTATYLGGDIYIVGGLGYLGQRQYTTTPTYRLNCTTFAMESVSTVGDGPGWIHRHRASIEGRNVIVTGGKIVTKSGGGELFKDNADVFILDLDRRQWSRRP
jgi:ankyrin repeat protein